GKHSRAEPRFRDEHRDIASLQPQCGRDFAPDEAAADHTEPHARAGERAQAAIVLERAEIDDLVRLERQPPRGPAGGEEQLPEAVFRALVVRRLMRRQIEPADPAAQVELRAGGRGLAPDLLLGLTL